MTEFFSVLSSSLVLTIFLNWHWKVFKFYYQIICVQ